MLTRWDPLAEIARLENQMNRLFGTRKEAQMYREGFEPSVDIFEDKDAFHLKVELPGMKPDDVRVNVENGVLTLKGERKLEREDRRDGYHRIEGSYGAFSRSFSLPKTLDAGHLEAEMNDGVLAIHIPKQAAPEPKRIPIKEGGTRQIKPSNPS